MDDHLEANAWKFNPRTFLVTALVLSWHDTNLSHPSIVISFSIAGKFPILAKYFTSAFSNLTEYYKMQYKTASDFKLDTTVYPPVDFSDMRSDPQDIGWGEI